MKMLFVWTVPEFLSEVTLELVATVIVLSGGRIWRFARKLAGAIRATYARQRELAGRQPVPVIRLGNPRGQSAILATAATGGGIGGAFAALMLVSLVPAWLDLPSLTRGQVTELTVATAMLIVSCWLCWSAAEGAWRDATAKVK